MESWVGRFTNRVDFPGSVEVFFLRFDARMLAITFGGWGGVGGGGY